jgi:hypothetical protein
MIYDNDISDQPKYKVEQVINKFMISIDVKPKYRIKVYYKWNKKQPNISNIPFITVDYDPTKREWYLGFFNSKAIYYGTIDDITGKVSLSI